MSQPIQHNLTLEHNLFCGITAGVYFRMLQENRFRVDSSYWFRAGVLSVLSAYNSVWSGLEHLRFSHKIRETELVDAPLFVLGHWRSGTTHLHNLLALDEQFGYANTYQAANPSSFLLSERLNTKLFSGLLPATRPMDNMALGFGLPQEDEIALSVLSLKSNYLGMAFSRTGKRYDKYLSFRGAPPEDVEEWQRTVDWYFRKLTYHCKRRLVIKSPPHTARIRHLLELYPNAQFVHIHRDPYRVFQSTRHYFNTAAWYSYLQRPDLDHLDAGILDRYNVMYDAFFEDLNLIPEGQFHELGFDDLETDPVGQLESVYSSLRLDGFEALRPRLETYLSEQRQYRKNVFRELPEADREVVAQRWRRNFDAWNYSV
jgi:hypothetical protein